MTVFLTQALETALTSNLCSKPPHQPGLNRDLPFHMLWLGLGHDKEGRNEMTSCRIQRRDTKQICNHKIVFIPGFMSPLRLLAGSLPLGGDRRYFNSDNFNSTPDPGFVVMTSHWPSHRGIKSSQAVTFMRHGFSQGELEGGRNC